MPIATETSRIGSGSPAAAETERQLITEDLVPPSRLNAKVPRDLETICLRTVAVEDNIGEAEPTP